MSKLILASSVFNFASLADIAAVNPELAAKVANGNQDKIDLVVSILEAGLEAGVAAMSIAQIEVVAIRAEITLPAAASVRKYLNTAIDQGSVMKPSKQTYALVAAGLVADETAAEPDAEEEDELAGLGE